MVFLGVAIDAFCVFITQFSEVWKPLLACKQAVLGCN
jgi:hypothetical protein